MVASGIFGVLVTVFWQEVLIRQHAAKLRRRDCEAAGHKWAKPMYDPNGQLMRKCAHCGRQEWHKKDGTWWGLQ